MLDITMTDLRNEITTCFESKHVPILDQLVKFDGFDFLEKEDAVKFFSGKSWNDVLDHLKSLKHNILSGADYRLEEWSVLEPNPRYYYLRAYLEFLLETLSIDDPDEQFVSDLFHQLYQTVFMYRDAAYSDTQKAILRKIAAYTMKTVEYQKGFEEWKEDIINNINTFVLEIGKHD